MAKFKFILTAFSLFTASANAEWFLGFGGGVSKIKDHTTNIKGSDFMTILDVGYNFQDSCPIKVINAKKDFTISCPVKTGLGFSWLGTNFNSQGSKAFGEPNNLKLTSLRPAIFYGKMTYEARSFDVYGKLGLAISFEWFDKTTASQTESLFNAYLGLGLGLGASYKFTEKHRIFVEGIYANTGINLRNKSFDGKVKYSAIFIGYRYHFF